MTHPSEDDTPWADPKIRKNYEAALGKFILAYNEIDFYIDSLFKLEFSKPDQKEMLNKIKDHKFDSRLLMLQILSETLPKLRLIKLPFKDIRDLNSQRNILAHGHMDQNPFDGSYNILSRKKAKDYSSKQVTDLAKKAEGLWEKLRIVEAQYWFDEIED